MIQIAKTGHDIAKTGKSDLFMSNKVWSSL